VEGPFESYFRLANKRTLDPGNTFKESVAHNKMIVISDGDLIRNDYKRTGEIMQLGFEPMTQKVFANKEFFANCVDYLIDDFGLIEVRTKEIKLRLLEKEKTDKASERNYWKGLNMGLPVALVLLFGLINHFVRKKRYE
jgi:gliding-associated putative ABC transporter substrate-binding component GldG